LDEQYRDDFESDNEETTNDSVSKSVTHDVTNSITNDPTNSVPDDATKSTEETSRISASVFLPVVTAGNAARSISLDTVELGVKQTSLPYGADGLDQNPCCREADLQGKNKKESDTKNTIVPKSPSIIRTKNIGVKRMRKAVNFKNIVDGQYFDEADGT